MRSWNRFSCSSHFFEEGARSQELLIFVLCAEAQESRRHWADYSQAKDLMFARTDTEVSPWYVVNSDDKKKARLNCIAHLLSRVHYKDLNPIETPLPPRQSDSDYKRPKITSQRFVPDIY
jgi:hypothetical protein